MMVVVLMLLELLENVLPRSRFKFKIRHGMLPRRTMIIVIVCGLNKSGKAGTAILEVFLTEVLCFVVLWCFQPIQLALETR